MCHTYGLNGVSMGLMQEVGDSGSLKLTATNGNVRLRLALSNDGAGRFVTQHCSQSLHKGLRSCNTMYHA